MQSPIFFNAISLEFSSDFLVSSLRGKFANCEFIAVSTFGIISSLVVSSIDWLSAPCSACYSMSAAINSALALSSAIIITSEGPAGMSIATPIRCAYCLAAITYWLPGPKIL